MELKAGDIVLVRGDSTLSKLIRWFEQSPGELISVVSHVGIMVDPKDIVEALNKTVRRDFRGAYLGRTVAVYRPLNLSEIELDKVVVKAETYVGRTYGYVKIAAHAIDRLLGGAYIARRVAGLDRYPICSWVVAQAYAVVGKTFGVPPGAAQPDDIWDFVTTNPDKYECIWPVSKLTKEEP